MTDAGESSSDGAAGLDRSSPAPDVSARDWARTRTSDATTPPPPPAAAAAEALEVAEEVRGETPPSSTVPAPAQAAGAEVAGRAEPASDLAAAPPASYAASGKAAVRAGAAPRRAPLPVQGLLAALTAGALAVAVVAGPGPLVVVVALLQVALVLAVLAVLDAPARAGAVGVAVGSALVSDAVVALDDGRIDRLPGVVGLALVASLLHQLVRRGRSRVTESLADTLLAVVLSAAAACLVALPLVEGGDAVLLLALGAAAGVLLVGRLGDSVLPRPVLAAGSTRGWPGLLLGLAAGAGVALLGADAVGLELAPSAAVLLGLAVAATVAAADLAADLGATELRPGRRDAHRASALRPTAALLPYAALGPVVLLAGRLVLS